MKRVICFDLWNTLVRMRDTSPSYEDFLSHLGVVRESVYPIVRDQLMVRRMSYGEMVAVLSARLGITLSEQQKREVAKLWQLANVQSEWVEGARSVLKCLAEDDRTRLVLATNTTEPGWTEVDRRLGVSCCFDSLFVSCREGVSKPASEVWRRILDRYPGLHPSRFWMIGDIPEDDLRVPKIMGWRTILVNHPDGVPITQVPEIITSRH